MTAARLAPRHRRALAAIAEQPCAAGSTTGNGTVHSGHLYPLIRAGLAERFTNETGMFRYRATDAGRQALAQQENP